MTATGAVQAMAFEYDGLGRCVRAADPQGTVVTRRYSLAGRLLREAQDGFEVGYEHEAAGLVTAIVHPSATRVDVHRYPNGRVESILVDGAELARYKWLGDLRRARTSYALFTDTGTGVAQQRQIIDRRDYKRDGTLSVLEHVSRGPGIVERAIAPMWRFAYRDGLLRNKFSADHGIDLTYDRALRLLRTIVDPIRDVPDVTRRSTVQERDAAGNVRLSTIVAQLAAGGGQVVRVNTDYGVTHAPGSRTTTVNGTGSTDTIGWDAAGRLRDTRIGLFANHPRLPVQPAGRTCHHDGFGRLVRVDLVPDDPAAARRVIHYRYDGFGRRVERVAQRVSATTGVVMSEDHCRYVFDGNRCIEEYERDSSAAAWRIARRFINGVGERELAAIVVDEQVFGEDIDGDGQVGGRATLVALQDHDDSVLGLVRMRQTAPATSRWSNAIAPTLPAARCGSISIHRATRRRSGEAPPGTWCTFTDSGCTSRKVS